jgi:DNA (cytosine-5)-methyltransferase 1
VRKPKPKQIDRYQIRFDQEVFIDLFSGGGGASMGIEAATAIPVFAAVNHNPDAIAMHMANHPYTKHYQTSVWDVDPLTVCEGRPVGLLWASPDCTHFSKARGGKPVNKNIRSLSWVVLKWALEVRPRVLMMENVEEIQTWGPLIYIKRGNEKVWVPDPERSGETFMAFIGMLTTGVPADHPALEEACHYLHITDGDPRRQKLIDGLGYDVEYRELVAADYGAPTTRKRFVLCGRCDGKPVAWPERTHAPRNSQEVESGKCKPWRSAAEIIDWSLSGYSIFDSKEEIKAKYGVNAVRPLADNTLKRVICGVDKHSIKSCNPFLVECNHSGTGHIRDIREPVNTVTGKHTGGVVQPVAAPFIAQHKFSNPAQDIGNPLSTITSVGAHELVSPVVAPFTFSNTGGSVGLPANEPVHTIRSAGGQVLASASLMCIGQTGGGDRLRDIREPVPTVVSKQEACLLSANLIQYHTETTETARTADLRTPINTVDASNRYGLATAQLVEYYGNGQAVGVGEPLHTVTSHDRDALALVHIQKYFSGGYTGCGDDAGAPLSTVTALPRHGVCAAHVVKFKGHELGTSPADPLPTITASGSYAECRAVLAKVDSGQSLGHWPKIRALLNKYCGYQLQEDEIILLIIHGIAYFIADILLRMLTPRELYNAMGFPPDYIIDRDRLGRPYPKSKQVARCGNAVCPPMAEAMVKANFPEYCTVDVSTLAQLLDLVSV